MPAPSIMCLNSFELKGKTWYNIRQQGGRNSWKLHYMPFEEAQIVADLL